MKKIVIFGAGKIGRSFIGQLFSTGGYEVIFVDVFKPMIDELNRRGKYTVVIKDEKESKIEVENVKGIYAGNEEQVINEICSAEIVATAVGQTGLQGIFPLLAKGLNGRFRKNPAQPLDIIIAENLRKAAGYFKTELKKHLPDDYPFEQLLGLVETSIGKMVPIMTKKDLEDDPLQIFAEPYNTLILDKKAFKNPIPEIDGLAPKENIKAWVDRKLFIHNLGHAATAYLGYLHNLQFKYIYEPLEIPEILGEVKTIMQQSANSLFKKYPDDFTAEDLNEHINDLLSRFQNRALGDTIFRVGSDLSRKLGPNDRIIGAIRLAQEMKLPFGRILHTLVCGCRFRATDEEGKLYPPDQEFEKIYKTGMRNVLINISGMNQTKDAELIKKAEMLNKELDLKSVK